MELINKVAESGIITIDLEDFYHKGERVIYDLKNNLFEELVLKEKEFREFIKNNDWTFYQGKNVSIICSADAIIPTWAYMLLMTKISPQAYHTIIGNLEMLEQSLFQKELARLDISSYKNAKVVIKGCSKLPVPVFAYGEITRLLLPIVQNLMYGEPCSTVPVYKIPRSLRV